MIPFRQRSHSQPSLIISRARSRTPEPMANAAKELGACSAITAHPNNTLKPSICPASNTSLIGLSKGIFTTGPPTRYIFILVSCGLWSQAFYVSFFTSESCRIQVFLQYLSDNSTGVMKQISSLLLNLHWPRSRHGRLRPAPLITRQDG